MVLLVLLTYFDVACILSYIQNSDDPALHILYLLFLFYWDIQLWYLNASEQAQTRLSHLNAILKMICILPHKNWLMYPLAPYAQTILDIMYSANDLPQHTESFFAQMKRNT
jgi:hypothetical protein